MRLHHNPFSSNARRAVMTALELSAPVELVLVDLMKGEHRAPPFLAKNPKGKVPVLEDGDYLLTESHAIMAYLADKTPGQRLYPTDLRQRGRVNEWLFWNAHHFAPSVAILNWEHNVKRFLGLGAADPNEVKRGETLVRDLGSHLNRHLAGRDFIAGDALSLADIAVATPLMERTSANLPLADLPNLDRWFERVQKLDSWRKTER